MARKSRTAKKGPPLTVGMLREVIKGLPDTSLVICNDTEVRGLWVAESAKPYSFLNTDLGINGACPYESQGQNTNMEVYFELKEPMLIIDFVRPAEERRT